MGNIMTVDELYEALHDAAEIGDIKGIQRYMTKGADVNRLVRREATLRPSHRKTDKSSRRKSEDDFVHTNSNLKEGEKLDQKTQGDTELKKKRIKVNALHTAAKRKGNVRAIQFILKRIDNVDEQDSAGNTVLHYASSFYNNSEALCLILRSKPKVNLQNNYGETPLFIATSYGCDMKIVERLLRNNADPNIGNIEGDTPLHACARWRGVDPLIPGILLRFGANPNLRNKHGQTPLHLAAESSNNSVLLLLKFNAKVRLRDNKGHRPSQVASSEDIRKILQEIEEDDLGRKIRNSNAADEEGFFHRQDQSVRSWMSYQNSFDGDSTSEGLMRDSTVGNGSPIPRLSDVSRFSGRGSRWSYGSFYNKFTGGGGRGMLHLPNGKDIAIPSDSIPFGTSFELTLKSDDADSKLANLENIEFGFDIKIELPGTAFLAAWMREMRIRDGHSASPYFSSLCWEGETSWKSTRELTDQPGADLNLNFSLEKRIRDPLPKEMPEVAMEVNETNSLSSESEDAEVEQEEDAMTKIDSEVGDCREGDMSDNFDLETEVSVSHHLNQEMKDENFEFYDEFEENGRIQHPIDPELATINEEDTSCPGTNILPREDASYAGEEELSSSDEELLDWIDLTDYKESDFTETTLYNSQGASDENERGDETSGPSSPICNGAFELTSDPQVPHPNEKEIAKNPSYAES